MGVATDSAEDDKRGGEIDWRSFTEQLSEDIEPLSPACCIYGSLSGVGACSRGKEAELDVY